jgi:hypothetical protein
MSQNQIFHKTALHTELAGGENPDDCNQQHGLSTPKGYRPTNKRPMPSALIPLRAEIGARRRYRTRFGSQADIRTAWRGLEKVPTRR